MNQSTNTQAEPQIIIKGAEVREFEKMLDEFPHGVAKKVIAFVNAAQAKRNQERNAEAQRAKTADEWTRMNEQLELYEQELKKLKTESAPSEDEGEE